MLVSVDDFELDINIPNTDETPIINRLTGYIGIYEPEYLEMLLGADLYTEFKEGLLVDPIPAKWTALQDAITKYQVAAYIYRAWVRKGVQSLSGTNVMMLPKLENAAVVSPIDDMVYNWNRMVDLSFKTVKFIQDNNADYGNYYLPDVGHYCYYGYWRRYCTTPDIFHHQNSFNI